MLFDAITGGGAGSAKKDEGASLTSVLETPALRVELALLVLLCADAMRSDLLATFDPDRTHAPNSSTATHPPSAPRAEAPTRDLISFDEPQHDNQVASDSDREDRKREIESTQIQALKRSGLTFFDKWRAGVMHRICDVLCVRGDVVRQAKSRRKQVLDDAARQKRGIPSLLDFDDADPFASVPKSEEKKHVHYETIETRLLALDEQKRVLILHCLLLLLLSLETYPAHSRVILLHLTSSLKLETDLLADHEKSVAQGLLATAASQMDAAETIKRQGSNDAASRRWKVGLAAVGGAVLIGVTGGLAAPLLAAGLGTVMGGLGLGVVSTYLGALAGSSVLVGSLFGAYGAKMTGNIMDRYAKEVQDFEFVPVQDPDRPSLQRDHEWAEEQDARDPTKREQHRLRVCIGISGWLSSPCDVNKPWEIIDAATTEPFALRFEMDAMLRMGTSLRDVLFSYAWDGIAYTVVSRTLLGALYAGLWPLGLVKAASVLDNPFSVAVARADKAGKVLAHALIDGVQGKRPVTLMGYSIGARVIYACLNELAEQHAFGLVESAVLMGTPAPSDSTAWRKIRSVVMARVVNVYSTEDYVLGFLYRSTKLEFGIAGLQEVKGVYGIENVDMSKLVNGHDRYRYLVGSILAKISFGDLNFNKVAEQERALDLAERRKQQKREEAKKIQTKGEQAQGSAESMRTPRTTVVNQSTSPNLVDVHKHEQSPVQKQPPFQRPAFVMQSRSGQQPSRQKTVMMDINAYENRRPSSTTPIPEMDPLNGVIPVSTPSSTLQATLPLASAASRRQIPSNMSSVTELKQPFNHTEALLDMSQNAHQNDAAFEQPLRSSDPSDVISILKVGPDVAVKSGQTVDSDDENYDDDAEEVGSEFGELSMVDPVPMDDFDYGLM